MSIVSFAFADYYLDNQRAWTVANAEAVLEILRTDIDKNLDDLVGVCDQISQNNDIIYYFGLCSQPLSKEQRAYFESNIIPLLRRYEYTNSNLIDTLTIYCANPDIPKVKGLVDTLFEAKREGIDVEILTSRSNIYQKDSDTTYRILRPLYTINEQTMSVLACEFSLENLFSVVYDSSSTYEVVIERYGQMIDSVNYTGGDYKDEKFWLSGDCGDRLGFTIYFKIDAGSEFNSFEGWMMGVYGSIIVGIVCMTVAINFLMHLLLKRLERVVAVMKKVASGELQYRIPQDSNDDEITQIVSTFNFLLDELDENVQKMLANELKKKDMQLLALQYQINPHFVCNALHTIQLAVLNKGDIVDRKSVV